MTAPLLSVDSRGTIHIAPLTGHRTTGPPVSGSLTDFHAATISRSLILNVKLLTLSMFHILQPFVFLVNTIFTFLTLPMPEGRGFLVRQPLRRLRRIGVLHDFPKREFPCVPRYIFIQAYAAVDLSSKALCRIFLAAFTSLS